MRKLALKKLKASDLSFFKSYFKRHPQSKQKGFNLDKKIVETHFFPAITALLEPLPKKAVHVDLAFFGPGVAGAHSLARKVKIDAKNLRLNGELVHDPEDEPTRYDPLVAGDFAVIEFDGAALPESVKIVLISAAMSADARLHQVFNQRLPNEDDSMIALTEAELQAAIDEATPEERHPIRDWLDPVILEEVGFGDANALQALNNRRPGRGINPSAFKATKEQAAKTGELGEELLNMFFDSPAPHGVASHDWVSQVNAISPFDFRLTMVSGVIRHIDAKSTSGEFDTPLHLSTAEIRHALNTDTPYDIYRLFAVTESSAKLRVARDIRSVLPAIADALAGFPEGVCPDSLSFKPSFFTFEEKEFFIKTPL